MKIGIVTAYDECEANSEYSKALKEEFERQGHSVEILRLPFSIFMDASRSMQARADTLIDEMAKKIPELDYVNIQYEGILFGCDCVKIKERVLKIINACKSSSFSLTCHSRVNFDSRKIKQNKLSQFIYKIRKKDRKLVQKNIDRMQYRILEAVQNKNGLIIAHTIRDKNRILSVLPKANVKAFPLSYKRADDIFALKQKFDKLSYQREKGLDLPDNTKKIGILGAFMYWKDFETVIKALCFLPENYHLFFYGGQHKLDFKGAPAGLPSIKNLQDLIAMKGLANRVHFMGYQPTSEDMLNGHLFCDCIVLPYIEIGESGSGSASMALETCENVFLARNHCFEELKNFCGEAVFNYDMGNYLELAEKIQTMPDRQRILKQRESYFSRYNVSECVKMYLSIME